MNRSIILFLFNVIFSLLRQVRQSCMDSIIDTSIGVSDADELACARHWNFAYPNLCDICYSLAAMLLA